MTFTFPVKERQDSMKRAMARQAEGESLAAAALGEASDTMMAHSLALQLRNLPSLVEIGGPVTGGGCRGYPAARRGSSDPIRRGRRRLGRLGVDADGDDLVAEGQGRVQGALGELADAAVAVRSAPVALRAACSIQRGGAGCASGVPTRSG